MLCFGTGCVSDGADGFGASSGAAEPEGAVLSSERAKSTVSGSPEQRVWLLKGADVLCKTERSRSMIHRFRALPLDTVVCDADLRVRKMFNGVHFVLSSAFGCWENLFQVGLWLGMTSNGNGGLLPRKACRFQLMLVSHFACPVLPSRVSE